MEKSYSISHAEFPFYDNTKKYQSSISERSSYSVRGNTIKTDLFGDRILLFWPILYTVANNLFGNGAE